MDLSGCEAELRDVLGFFRRALQPSDALSGRPANAETDQDEAQSQPDGPYGGCWLWWQGKRHDIPKGAVYRLLEFMWNKDYARYEMLAKEVFDLDVTDGTIRARVSEVNKKVLEKFGVSWRLSTNSSNRYVTKRPV
jgi:hypothetical protein